MYINKVIKCSKCGLPQFKNLGTALSFGQQSDSFTNSSGLGTMTYTHKCGEQFEVIHSPGTVTIKFNGGTV